MTQKCRTKKGESCLSSGSQCQSGATCVPRSGGDGMVCQCTDQSNVNKASAECEPVTNAVGGSCTDQSCSDPNAICKNGICDCINGTTLEISNYTCGFGPGKDCRNITDACNSGTVCDRTGLCQLIVGQSCQGEDRGRCSTGLACDNDICKLFLNMDCGDTPSLCNTGTVCDVNNKCKLTQGSNCGEDTVCVGGANCVSNKCTCISGITRANGSTCEPVTGKVHGKCSDGTSCEDQNAVCNTTTDLCICKQGFAPEPDTLACGVAKGESCVDNPSSCIAGTTCDPTTHTCRLKPGQICDTNMDCETNAICDILGECKLDLNGACKTTDSHCRSGTFCDPFEKCRYGEADGCNNTEQCAAGAVCESKQCACSRESSKSNGAMCAPNSGRIGSDCGEVAVCDASLGGTCGPTHKCECAAGTAVLHDFRCKGYSGKQDDVADANTSVKKDLTLIIGSVLWVLALLACVGLIFGILGRRKNKKKKEAAMSERDTNMAALQALSTTVDADRPSVSNENVSRDTASQESGSSNSGDYV
ncbi:multiple epidermal growth factor-like domains protein 10 isoform X2 [Littorina saxatilis]|uniref:multiple epidermal growth factor-like domains protein 10 isoform X2 n=1 Tax=Littorina saxatilis TaxID=31220 RepID=UPI0038B443F4